jgi:hypothetical protein
MDVHPVRRYRKPGFPTRVILNIHPELLRLVPKRWRGNPVVLTALATVCIILTTARGDWARGAAAASKVAPIFEHGEGRGATGCQAINPPVFLSEAEARQVIAEEAKKAGLSFAANAKRLQGVQVPVTDTQSSLREPSPGHPGGKAAPRPGTRRRSLVLDGFDSRRKVGYEFVSASDYDAWEEPHKMRSTVSLYEVRGAAATLQEGLTTAKPEGTYAVFYDPAARYEDPAEKQPWRVPWERRAQEANKTAREELRKQVRDFLAWLKAQGVI